MHKELAKVLPQKDPMILIDKIIAITSETAHSQTIITEDKIIYDPKIQGIPTLASVEFIAQTIGAFAFSQQNSEKPQVGFIMSIRNFTSNKAYFKLGATLDIIVQQQYLAEGLGIFTGQVLQQGQLIVTTKINTFQPPEEQLMQYIATGED